MALPRPLEAKHIESKEAKSHPIIDAYKNNFISITTTFDRFIFKKDKKSEVDIIVLLDQFTEQDKAELIEYLTPKYAFYLQENVSHDLLTARELTFLGLMCYYKLGNDSLEYSDMAIHFFDLAMKKGDAFAWYGMGLCVKTENDKEIYFNRAIEANIAVAHYELAMLLKRSNHQKAVEHLRKADEFNVARASWILGNSVSGIRRITSEEYVFEIKENNDEKSYQFYVKAAEHGMADALNSIASMFRNGVHLQQNTENARLFYESALERIKRKYIPLLNLSEYYATCNKDVARSSWYLRRACMSRGGVDKATARLKNLNAQYKQNMFVLFNASIGLQNVGDAKERNQRRADFNRFHREQPARFNQCLAQYNDPPEVYEPLIDLSPDEEREYHGIFVLFASISRTPYEISAIMLKYLCIKSTFVDQILTEMRASFAEDVSSHQKRLG